MRLLSSKNFFRTVLALFLLFQVLSSQQTDSLHFYEKTFNPSIYDVKDAILPKSLLSDEDEQTLSGYRVQVLVTTKLDSANSVRSKLQSILSSSRFNSEKVYIVYEPPNYKVRVGDFTQLQEASLVREFLIANGFQYAWIVIDRVKRKSPR